MAISGSCHCGAVRLEAPGPPEWVGSCNCSLCRRTGWVGAYYPDGSVRVEGETVAYIWGDRLIAIHHCPTCACLTHWRPLDGTRDKIDRMGVNARLLDAFEADRPGGACLLGETIEVRLFDNAGG